MRCPWTVIPYWRRASCSNLNPILGFTCKIYPTISSREVLSMSVTDSIKVVTPNSFLRLCKVLAMAAQQNTVPIRSYCNKSSEILSLRRPTRPDLTTPTLAVESCSSFSACNTWKWNKIRPCNVATRSKLRCGITIWINSVHNYKMGRKFSPFLGIVANARIKILIPWISKERTFPFMLFGWNALVLIKTVSFSASKCRDQKSWTHFCRCTIKESSSDLSGVRNSEPIPI